MNWTFTDPKGRTLDVSGETDAPPSEQELDQLFSQAYPEQKKASMAGEVGKGLVRSYDNLAGGVGSTINWIGENIANDKELVYKQPFGKEQTVQVRKSDFEKKLGAKMARFGQNIYDYWSDRTETGPEAPDPETFKGSFMENPSWTRAAAYVAEGVPSLGFAAALTAATKSPLAGASVLGITQGAETYRESRAAGKDVRASNVYGGVSAVGNTILEQLPLHAFLHGTEKTAKTAVGRLMGKVFKTSDRPKILKEMFYGMAVEGGEEGVQQVWTNLIAKIGYEPTRDIAAGVVESIIGGAGSGGIVAGLGARTLQRNIDAAKKKGMTESDLSLMTEQISKQMVKHSDKIEPVLEKQLGIFEEKALSEGVKQTSEGIEIEGPRFSEKPAYGTNLPLSEVRRVPLTEVADEHKYQVEGRGLNVQVVEDIKKKISSSEGGEIPINITKPVLLNKEGDKYFILGGHHRISAFKELGFSDVDAVIVSVSPDIARELAKKDNIQFNDPPTVQGMNFRKEMQSGKPMPDIIFEFFGPVNETSKKWFSQTVNASYLPGAARELIDNGTIPLEVGSVLGERIKLNGLDLSPDSVMTLFQKFHVEQGLSAPALGKVLDTILSVAKSKTTTKEKQLDLFGKMVNTPDVVKAAADLERTRQQAQSLKRQMDSLVKKAGKDKVQLKPETVQDLKGQVDILDKQVNALNEKLYKFKLESFVGPVQHVISESQTVEGQVEPGVAGTPEIPDFKGTKDAIAFGKLNRGKEEIKAAMLQMVAELQPHILEATKEGAMQRGMDLAVKSQFLKESLRALEGEFDQPQELKPRFPAAMEAKGQEQLDLFVKPDEESNLKDDAGRTGDTEKVETILQSEQSISAADYEEFRQNSLLKRAADLRRKREAKGNVIDSKDREVMVYTFEAALKKYGIDKNELARMIKKWLPMVALTKYNVPKNDLLSYAWEGAMVAMGAKSDLDLQDNEIMTTKFDPNRETKVKAKDTTEKFFNYARDYMKKWIMRYGLPTEKRTVSVPDYNVTENMNKFINLMEEAGSYEEAKERWGEFMVTQSKTGAKPMAFSESTFKRYLDAYYANSFSLDAQIGNDDEKGFSMMDVYERDQVEDMGSDKDLGDFGFEQSLMQEEMEAVEDDVRKKGPVKAMQKAMEKLAPTERDIVSLAFGLIGAEYGVQRTSSEIADILASPSSSDLFGQFSKETVSKSLVWTTKKVEKVLADALKKLSGSMELIQIVQERRGREAQVGPNESGDILFAGGQGIVPDTASPKDLDNLLGDLLGNERGSVRIPVDINPIVKEEWSRKMKDTEFAFTSPYWYARKYPLAAKVFNPILKSGIYQYNAYASTIQSIMNGFVDVNALGAKRADAVSELLYKNAGKEEWQRARKLHQEVQWYTPDQLKNDFHLDDEQVKVFQQFVRLSKFEVALLKRQYRLANNYYEKRAITINDGNVDFESEETDEQWKMRRFKIDEVIKQKFPPVYVPINRYGNVWVVATKFSHNDKKGRPVNEQQFHLVEAPTHLGALFTEHGEIKQLRSKLEAEGFKVDVNPKSYLANEKSWNRMDLFELERLMEYAGLNWTRAEYRTQPNGERAPLNDLAKLQDFVDKVRASKGGIYGNFLRRDWKSGHKTDAEHLKRSMINFGEGAARFLTRFESHQQANEALKEIPHGEKAPREMQQLHENMASWLNSYKNADTGTWAGIRSAYYMFFLSWKMAFFFQNLTQPVFTTYFRLGRELVGPQAEQVFVNSYKMAAQYLMWEKGSLKEVPFDKDLMAALNKAKKEEVITGTFTDMLLATKKIQAQSGKGKDFTGGLQDFFTNGDYRMMILGMLGTKSEKLNRTHAFMAGWQVGQKKGLMGEILYDFAADYVNGTQWAYGSHNLPYALTKLPPTVRAVIQTVFLFQTHTYNWFQFSLQELREALAHTPDGKREYERLVGLMGRMMVAFFLWTGAAGVPLFAVFNKLLRMATKKHFHQHVRDFLWVQFPHATKEWVDSATRIMVNGYLSHATDTDFSGQLGFGNAINVEYAKSMDEFMLGAAYTKTKAIATYAIPTLIEGMRFNNTDQKLRAGEVGLPSAAAQILRGIRLGRDRAYRLRSGEKISDHAPTTGNFVKTGMGFNSLSKTHAFYEREAKQDLRQSYEKVQQMYSRQATDARNRRDFRRLKEINKEMRAYNNEHPEARIRISKQSFRNAKRRFGKGTDIKRFPKAIRKEVREVERKY